MFHPFSSGKTVTLINGIAVTGEFQRRIRFYQKKKHLMVYLVSVNRLLYSKSFSEVFLFCQTSVIDGISKWLYCEIKGPFCVSKDSDLLVYLQSLIRFF